MRYAWFRCSVFLLVAIWPVYWLYQAWIFALGPDPGKVLVDRMGLGALILLLITLALTPLQRMTGWAGWVFIRRQMGLWCFAWAVLHLAAYLFFVLGLAWDQLGVELSQRPYIIVGALALLMLMVLAVTSNRFSQRRLGKRWKALHKLAYAVLGLGLLHFLWIVRADLKQWAAYALIGAVLLALRIPAVAARLPRFRKKSAYFQKKA